MMFRCAIMIALMFFCAADTEAAQRRPLARVVNGIRAVVQLPAAAVRGSAVRSRSRRSSRACVRATTYTAQQACVRASVQPVASPVALASRSTRSCGANGCAF